MVVKFIKDFATKVTGDIMKVDSMLASDLVNIEKVAEYFKVEVKSDTDPVKVKSKPKIA